jgi:chemotaxis protein CheD
LAVVRHSRAFGPRHTPDELLVEIGVGGYGIAEHPEALMTPALGSCVGVAIWDPATCRGGLAHVMLPAPVGVSVNPCSGRFASWAVPQLVEMMVESGSQPRRLRAKIAGGAAMFRGGKTVVNVGERNLAEVRRQLELAQVALVAEDTGGSHARTVELRLDSGLLIVRSYNSGTMEL